MKDEALAASVLALGAMVALFLLRHWDRGTMVLPSGANDKR